MKVFKYGFLAVAALLVGTSYAESNSDIEFHCGPKYGEGFHLSFVYEPFEGNRHQYSFSALLVSVRPDGRAQILRDYESADDPIVVESRREMVDFLKGKLVEGDTPLFVAKDGTSFLLKKGGRFLQVGGHSTINSTYRCGAIH